MPDDSASLMFKIERYQKFKIRVKATGNIYKSNYQFWHANDLFLLLKVGNVVLLSIDGETVRLGRVSHIICPNHKFHRRLTVTIFPKYREKLIIDSLEIGAHGAKMLLCRLEYVS